MGGAPDIPQVDPAAVLGAIRQNLGPMVQKQYGLARQYGPKFAGLDLKTAKEFAPQFAQLGFDLSKQFAPQFLGLNLGQMAANIAGQPLLKALNKQALGGLQTQGADPLLQQLTTQARQQLAQGGHLTPQEAYQQTQGTLGTFAGRNNVFNQAEAQAFLDRDALVRKRLQEAQQFGMGVEGQRQSALNLAQSFGLGTQAQNLGSLAGLSGVAQMPNLAAYGAPGASFGSMGAGIGASSGTVGQIAPIVSEIFGSNQSAAANQAIGGANKTAGIAGGALSAVGSIAAAY